MMGLTDTLRDILQFDFWRHAIVGGVVTALVCSVLSVFVVLRRMAFIGQGISHSAFGGIALGVYLFGSSSHAALGIYATAVVFCIVIAWLIAGTTREGHVSEDSAIGIFLVVSMAVGIVFFQAAHGYTQDAMSYLFGSVLAMTREELAMIGGLALLVLLPLVLLQKELLFYAFDARMARVAGVPVTFLHYLLLTLLAVTIVISTRLIGIVLVSAFLVLPAATAQMLVGRFRTLMILSVSLGVFTTLVGLLVCGMADIPAGAAIVLTQFAFFLAAMMYRRAKTWLRSRLTH